MSAVERIIPTTIPHTPRVGKLLIRVVITLPFDLKSASVAYTHLYGQSVVVRTLFIIYLTNCPSILCQFRILIACAVSLAVYTYDK